MNIEKLLEQAISKSGYTNEKIVLQKPKHEKFGDYSTPLAMQIAKKIQKNPMEIANVIVKNLPIADYISKAEVVAPGFINIYLDKSFAFNLAKKTLDKKYIKSEVLKRVSLQIKDGILVEHTHVNPSKSMHIGHLRNTFIGDSLVRLYRFLGLNAYALYYQNDVGMQVSALSLAKQINLNESKNYDSYLGWADDTYSKISTMIKQDPELEAKREEIHKEMIGFDSKSWDLALNLSTNILKEIFDYLAKINVEFDFIIKESDVLINQVWEKAFDLLLKNSSFYKADSGDKKGCYMLKMPNQDDKIIVRSNGVPTYVGNDIALHLWKYGQLDDFNYARFENLNGTNIPVSDPNGNLDYQRPQINTVVNVVGNEQSYPQEVVKQSLKALGHTDFYENFIHVNYGFVYLSPRSCDLLGLPYNEGDTQIKISGRAGTVLTAHDFILHLEKKLHENFPDSPELSNIAVTTAKYELLKIDTFKDIVFDLERACDLKGNTGSYILYTYARMNAVLQKAENDSFSEQDIANLNEFESNLLTEINNFLDAITKFYNNFTPSTLCSYLQNLCLMYNSFYSNSKIIGAKEENQRLLLTKISFNILELSFELLGLNKVNKM
ncbi:arginine--tRNA ligase [bacterium]|nr:arginine--tRNA ligase [bacterium]|tara:strand:+ start:907 stop:2730 length:1824 start_codon:yes stop_codon:yes gene_type:complete